MGTIPLQPTGAEFERVDNTPVELPTRLRLPQSRTDQIRQFIREEMSRAAFDQGHDTFGEADDLEPDDEDYLPVSPYEMNELEPPAPLEPPPPLQNGVEAEGRPAADPPATSKDQAAPSHGGVDGPK